MLSETCAKNTLTVKWAASLLAGAQISYGTAGFRARAEFLPSTVFRMGVLAALRALNAGKDTGIMITASHNPIDDNGVKLSDPSGDMLDVSWEPYANRLANANSVEDFEAVRIYV